MSAENPFKKSSEVRTYPRQLDSIALRQKTTDVELELADMKLSPQGRAAFLMQAIIELNTPYWLKRHDQRANIIGRATIADKDRSMTAETRIFAADGVTFEGITVAQPDGPGRAFKVLLEFSDEVERDLQFGKRKEYYYMTREDILKLEFEPDLEADQDDSQLRALLANQASRSESILKSRAFLEADAEQQHHILDGISEHVEEVVSPVLGKQLLAIDSNQYTLTAPGDTSMVFNEVDQTNETFDHNRRMIIGFVRGCTFVESETHTSERPMSKLRRLYPSLVVENPDNTEITLIPIRNLVGVSYMDDYED